MASATAILEYSSSKPTPAVLCPNCGSYCPVASGAASSLGDENQRRIAELEAQVSLLKKSAADAADRSPPSQSPPRPSTAPGDRPHPPATPATSSASRFGALLLGGSTTTSPQQQQATPAPTPSSTLLRKLSGSGSVASSSHAPTNSAGSAAELAARLAREQDLRQRAEGQAAQMSSELEELSASLFAQANEMVAAERRARAKLEERVVILERRDGEKRVRLERLEKALRRIERVKGVLGET